MLDRLFVGFVIPISYTRIGHEFKSCFKGTRCRRHFWTHRVYPFDADYHPNILRTIPFPESQKTKSASFPSNRNSATIIAKLEKVQFVYSTHDVCKFLLI